MRQRKRREGKKNKLKQERKKSVRAYLGSCRVLDRVDVDAIFGGGAPSGFSGHDAGTFGTVGSLHVRSFAVVAFNSTSVRKEGRKKRKKLEKYEVCSFFCFAVEMN